MIQESHWNKYSWQYLQKQRDSLTVTRLPLQLLQSILKKPVLVWIDDNDNGQFNYKTLIEECLGQVLHNFGSVKQAKQLIDQIDGDIILICSLKLSQQVQSALCKYQNIRHILCYCKNLKYFHQLRQQNLLSPKFQLPIDDLLELIKSLKLFKQKLYIEKRKQKFLFLKNQQKEAYALAKTFSILLSQKTNRLMIIQSLQNIIKKIDQRYEQKLVDFLGKCKDESFNTIQTLKQFLKQDSLYRIVTNILGQTKNPLQLFSIQPLIKDIFSSIQGLYIYNKSKKCTGGFVCYKGGILPDFQISKFGNNLNNYVQTLGFLSATKDQEKAKQQIVNVLFVIKVKSLENKGLLDHGYLQLPKSSQYQGRHDVVFNYMSLFQVQKLLKVEKQQKSQYLQIWLSYGQPKSLKQKYQQKMQTGQSKKSQQTLYNLQKIRKSSKNSKQIQIISSDYFNYNYDNKNDEASDKKQKQNYELLIMYWKKYIELQIKDINPSAQIFGFLQLANIEEFNKSYSQALKYYQKCYDRLSTKQEIKYPSLDKITYKIASIHFRLNNLDTSLKYYQQYEQMVANMDFKSCYQQYINTLLHLSHIYHVSKNYKHARTVNQKCAQIMKKTKGQTSIQYAKVLYNLAELYEQQRQYERSLQMYERCRVVYAKLVNQDNAKYLYLMGRIDKVKQKLANDQRNQKKVDKQIRNCIIF